MKVTELIQCVRLLNTLDGSTIDSMHDLELYDILRLEGVDPHDKLILMVLLDEHRMGQLAVKVNLLLDRTCISRPTLMKRLKVLAEQDLILYQRNAVSLIRLPKIHY